MQLVGKSFLENRAQHTLTRPRLSAAWRDEMTRDEIIDELHKPGKFGTLIERALDEIDRLRADNAAKDARIAELTGRGDPDALLTQLLDPHFIGQEGLRLAAVGHINWFRKRAEKAEAELATSHRELALYRKRTLLVELEAAQRRIDALSGELADAKATKEAYAIWIEHYKKLHRDANARIVELEGDDLNVNWPNTAKAAHKRWLNTLARAERAEAHIKELRRNKNKC